MDASTSEIPRCRDRSAAARVAAPGSVARGLSQGSRTNKKSRKSGPWRCGSCGFHQGMRSRASVFAGATTVATDACSVECFIGRVRKSRAQRASVFDLGGRQVRQWHRAFRKFADGRAAVKRGAAVCLKARPIAFAALGFSAWRRWPIRLPVSAPITRTAPAWSIASFRPARLRPDASTAGAGAGLCAERARTIGRGRTRCERY
jgi:hypothetical protein